MQSVLRFILRAVPFMGCALLPLLIWRICRVRALTRRGLASSPARETVLFLFFLFLVGLASLTVCPPVSWEGGLPHLIPTTGRGGLNLIPFKIVEQTWYEVFVYGNRDYFLINCLGNIILFLPIGFCPPLLWRMAPGWSVLIGALSSLCIELCQLPMARGTDVDDLILNTFGALLGMLLFLLLRRIAPRFCARFHVHTI